MIITTTPPDLPVGIVPEHSEHIVSDPPLPGLPLTRWVYRFPGGYGASVLRGAGSYGGGEGLYEVAVIRFTGPGPEDFDVLTDEWDDARGAYAPSIPHAPWTSEFLTRDVHGWQDIPQVMHLLAQIGAIPAAPLALEMT